jgi:hypothetical protein
VIHVIIESNKPIRIEVGVFISGTAARRRRMDQAIWTEFGGACTHLNHLIGIVFYFVTVPTSATQRQGTPGTRPFACFHVCFGVTTGT